MIHYAFEVELFSHAGDVNMKTVKEKKINPHGGFFLRPQE